MHKINKVAIVGLGALGMMYGEHIISSGKADLYFIMDEARLKKHKNDTYTVNNINQSFKFLSPKAAVKMDLIIIATKFNGLDAAIQEIVPFVDDNTIIFSVLNGITSEEKLRQRFGKKNILHCVVLGMDAVRTGTTLTYQHKGIVKIGAVDAINNDILDELCAFFEEISLPYSKEADILHALWAKLLLNVGINQTCMIYETSYGGAFANPEARENMYSAMHEVIEIAKAEGVNLTEADFEASVKVLKSLSYDGMPSMRQDGLAHRKTEVDLFAGTIIALGKKHGISTPINQIYYDRIKSMEEKWIQEF